MAVPLHRGGARRLGNIKRADTESIPSIHKVRSGLFQSLTTCVSALAAGAVSGWVFRGTMGLQIPVSVTLIVIGTSILLWATLAVQGWNIQSYGGVTLTERVNRWIFRFLYTVGTYLLVAGSVWSVL